MPLLPKERRGRPSTARKTQWQEDRCSQEEKFHQRSQIQEYCELAPSDAGLAVVVKRSAVAFPPERACPFVSAPHPALWPSLRLSILFKRRHDVDDFLRRALPSGATSI